MTDKQILENNKLIAEFMDVFISDYTSEEEEWIKTFNENDLLYHNSWDWLMPVVVKINSTTSFTVVIQSMDCYVYNADSGIKVTSEQMKWNPDELIKSVYDTVIQFIKYLNNIPSVLIYGQYLNKAAAKFNLTIDECRNRYGQYT